MSKANSRIDDVTVTLRVADGDFIPVPSNPNGYKRGSDDYTRCTIAPPVGTPRVTLVSAQVLGIQGGGSGKPVGFRILISPPGVYAPVGIAFLQRAPNGKAVKRPKFVKVRENFLADEVIISNGALNFTDNCDKNTLGCRFEFYVLIQCQDPKSPFNGRLGIIDPGIQHDNSNLTG